MEQAARAAAITASAVRFCNSLRDEVLLPEIFHTKGSTEQAWFRNMMRLVPESIAYYPCYLLGGACPFCLFRAHSRPILQGTHSI